MITPTARNRSLSQYPLLQRIVPQPTLSLVLVVVWLMLANKLTLAQCLLAALFAWLLPLLLQQLSTRKLLLGGFLWHVPRIVKPWLLLRFVVMVGWDIAVANFEVAVQILQPNRRLRPTFVEMPLVVQDEFVIALLMSVITLTPGTLAAQLSGDRRNLLIHVLHTNDPAALIEQLQQRYERPLQKIFAS